MKVNMSIIKLRNKYVLNKIVFFMKKAFHSDS